MVFSSPLDSISLSAEMSMLSLFSSTDVVVLTAFARDSLSVIWTMEGLGILNISESWDASSIAPSLASEGARVSAAKVDLTIRQMHRLCQQLRLAMPPSSGRLPPLASV